MGDPAKRAALVAKLGAAEAERITNLSEDQLVEEMINAGEVEVEQSVVQRLKARVAFLG